MRRPSGHQPGMIRRMRRHMTAGTRRDRNPTLIAAVASALTVISCAAPSTSPAETSGTPETGDRPLTAQQTEGLRDAITSAGDRCSAVSRTFLQGVQDDRSEFWNVQCPEGAYSVMIPGAGGETRIMTCQMIEAVTRVPCFQPFTRQTAK